MNSEKVVVGAETTAFRWLNLCRSNATTSTIAARINRYGSRPYQTHPHSCSLVFGNKSYRLLRCMHIALNTVEHEQRKGRAKGKGSGRIRDKIRAHLDSPGDANRETGGARGAFTCIYVPHLKAGQDFRSSIWYLSSPRLKSCIGSIDILSAGT